jgi:hypothetical protein
MQQSRKGHLLNGSTTHVGQRCLLQAPFYKDKLASHNPINVLALARNAYQSLEDGLPACTPLYPTT